MLSLLRGVREPVERLDRPLPDREETREHEERVRLFSPSQKE